VSLILAAHGTRRPGGVAMIGDLAARVGALLGQTVQVSFVDVLGPTPSEVLSASTDPRAIVVPAFLSRGYHVRTDLPAHVAASGHRNVVVTPALGPGGRVVRIVADQLAQIGCFPGDSVILGAAGTSDAHARKDLHTTATGLSALTGSRVSLAFAAVGDPHIDQAVEKARDAGARRVVVASYLLSDGLFQERLHASGADLVSRPLGTHPWMARLIADRFCRAVPSALRHRHRRPGAPTLAMLDL
jgi:sirohydrochlorin ferrochelatase